MSANFNYYLNRQGPRGKQGEKGEEGFSPVITVAQDDSTTYKLLIQSQDGYTETPNLKANPLQITQGGGKYVLYDTENNIMYNAQKPSELVDTSMYATTSDAGIIAIADEQDLTDSATNVAVTPKQLNDAIDAVESEIPDAPNNGVLTIQQNGVNIATFSADSATNVTANIQTPTNVVTTDTNQTITGNKNFEGTLLYDGNEVATLNDIPSIPTNYVTTDTTQTITGNKDFTGSLTIDGDTVATTNDIPSLTNYVQKTDYATTAAAGVVKVDGTTIAVTNDGTISAVGSAPSNMVTTNTEQTITGIKMFSGNTLGVTSANQNGLVASFSEQVLHYWNNTSSSSTVGVVLGGTLGQYGPNGLCVLANARHIKYNATAQEYQIVKLLDQTDVDGTTIVYNNGVISAVSQTPSVIDGGEEV